jgi:hypothetical protein
VNQEGSREYKAKAEENERRIRLMLMDARLPLRIKTAIMVEIAKLKRCTCEQGWSEYKSEVAR